MSNSTKIALITAVLFFLPIIAIIAIIAGVSGAASALLGGGANGSTIVNPVNCAAVHGGNSVLAGYQSDQITNAATIVAVGKQLHVPEQGLVVAIAAAMQESGLHNLDYGDRDSLGLFQQRPSQGWGAPAQIMNPIYAATQFYRRLFTVPGWQQINVNDAAQAVQRSGFPNAYAQHEQAARVLVAVLGSANCWSNP